ncbi:MAG: YIP1 family protein [Acidobacteriota bacterium]
MSDNGSALSWLVAVLTSPAKTFAQIAEKPRWWVPMVVMILGVGALTLAVHARTDYREHTANVMEMRNVHTMSAEDLDRAAEMQEKFGSLGAVIGGIAVGVIMTVIGLFYWVLLRLMGSEITFAQSLGTHLWGAIPVVLGMLIAIPIVLAGGDLSTEQLLSRNFMASNLTFLAGEDTSPLVFQLLASIDFFAIWSVIITALGFQIVGRVSKGVAWGAVLLMTLLGVAIRLGSTLAAGGG